ncbi:hypothetical protein [Streptomyces sp. NPDC055013]
MSRNRYLPGKPPLRTAQHPYGFEAADLVAAHGTPVHVKRADSSAPLSLKSGKPLTTQNLFTLSQMSLLQAARALRAQGIEVAVVDIPTV